MSSAYPLQVTPTLHSYWFSAWSQRDGGFLSPDLEQQKLLLSVWSHLNFMHDSLLLIFLLHILLQAGVGAVLLSNN